MFSNIGMILIQLIIVDYLIHLCMLIGNTLNTEINCHHFLSIFKQICLNLVNSYVPWNAHEEVKGHFKFDGNLDIR